MIECREALAFPGDPHRVVAAAPDHRHRRRRPRAGRVLDARAEFGQHRHARLTARRRRASGQARTGALHLRWTRRAREPRGHGRRPALRAELDVCPRAATTTSSSRSATGRCPPARPTRTGLGGTEQPGARRARARRHASPRATPGTPTPCCAGSPAPAAAWSPPPPCACPSAPRPGRNYDYRYVWIRDQCYAGQAVAARRPAPAAGRRGRASSPTGCSTTGPSSRPPTRIDGGRVPRPSAAGAARLPRRPRRRRQLGQRPSSSSTRSARRCCCSPPPPATTGSTPTTGGRSTPPSTPSRRAGTEPDAGIWELDDDRWTHSRLICVAGLRAVAAHVAAPALRPRLVALADAILADTAAHALHRDGPLAARPRTTRRGRRAAAAAHPRRAARRRPAHASPPWRPSARAGPGRLRLPLPPRRPAAGRRRGRLPALRVHHVPWPAISRATRRGVPLVRAQPARPAARRAVLRGVRRRASASCAATCPRPSCTR